MKKVLFLLIAASFMGTMISCSKKTEEIKEIEPEIEQVEETPIEEPVVEEFTCNLEQWGEYRINSPEGLRVRDKNSLDGKVINKYPDNLIVKITEIEPTPVEIDGIKSCWVKVYHNTDTAGWVFGGYLKEMEKLPDDGKKVNDYTYDDFKTEYGNLKATDIQKDWKAFYIFSKDYIAAKQQLDLDRYDMYTLITEKDYKIFTGLYLNNDNDVGGFIAKVNPDETEVLEVLLEPNNGKRILFLKPWYKGAEFLSVGNWFESEAFYYISKNHITERLFWDDDY